MNYILKTNDLSKKYKDEKVVNNVNMTIHQKDIYGFVGPNGAGKTTIIRLICGLINPTEGDFTLFDINNKDNQINEVRKNISAVVESPSLYRNLSAYDNLKMQCIIMGINDDNLIKESLQKVGLEYLYDSKKKIRHYSLGMRQRLGIAMALISKPSFLLLDEPMNGLDPEGIVEIRELILKLNQEEGLTILISSHILDELSKVATCYGFINKGKLIQEISAEELNKKSHHYLFIRVKHIDNLNQLVIDNNLFTSYEINGDIIKVYDDITFEDAFYILKKQGLSILAINTCEESVEDYYLQLLGGHHHA